MNNIQNAISFQSATFPDGYNKLGIKSFNIVANSMRRGSHATIPAIRAGDLMMRTVHGAPRYIVAPSTHGANSAPPKSKLSLFVASPDATRSIRSKMR